MKRQIAALLGLLLLTGAFASAAAPTEIWASGSHTIALNPDIATVNATITTNAPDAASAVSQNNSRYDSSVAAVMRAGVARSDVTLSYYNVNYMPKPQPQPGEVQVPTGQQWGYTVTRSFAVKVHALAKAGNVVDAITGIEGTTIGGVDFGVADSSKAQREAMTRAVSDARSQAEALASAAGLHIVGIKQIMQGGGAPIVQPMMRMTAMAAPVPTTFDASSVNVRAEVTVIYLAEP